MRKNNCGLFVVLLCVLLSAAGCSREASRLNKEGLEHYASGDYAGAVSVFEKAIVADNQKPDYQVNKGMAHLELGEYTNAINCFENALRLDSEKETAYRGKGIAYLEAGDYETAIEAFRQALAVGSGKVGPMEYDILFYQGEALVKAGRYSEAIETYRVLKETRGSDADTEYLDGVAKAKEAAAQGGDFSSAIAAFDQALKLDASTYSRYLNVYYCLADCGQAESGKEYLKQALTIKDSSSAAHKSRGTIHFLLEDYSAALSEFQYEGGDADTEILICIGLCYEAIGEYDTSYEYFERVLERGGKTPEILYQMGMCMFSMEQYSKAVEYFSEAMSTEGTANRKEMMYCTAICHERLGQFAEAKAAFESYVTAYGGSPEIEREICFLETR